MPPLLPLPPRLIVIGGNGYLGSAICKAAIARGWNVESVSSSGKPSLTPAGHARKWSTSPRMKWLKGSAFDPDSYKALFSIDESTSSSNSSRPTPPIAVIHTLGILLETDYKPFIRKGDVLGLVGAVMGGGKGNPLKKRRREETYEGMNRDSAIIVLKTLLSSLFSSTAIATAAPSTPPIPFVYISAEDTFPPPLVPRRYVETKREAEREVMELCGAASAGASPNAVQIEDLGTSKVGQGASVKVRPVLIRPGLMYHPHIRPLSTPLAVLLDISSSLHRRLSFLPSLPMPLPASIRNTLSTPPIHVDHVAEAVLRSVEDEQVRGVVDTEMMRGMVGWEGESGHGKVEGDVVTTP